MGQSFEYQNLLTGTRSVGTGCWGGVALDER